MGKHDKAEERIIAVTVPSDEFYKHKIKKLEAEMTVMKHKADKEIEALEFEIDNLKGCLAEKDAQIEADKYVIAELKAFKERVIKAVIS